MTKYFAAFVITYERPKEVVIMLDNLLKQSFPPERILVVDNSDSNDTQEVISRVTDARVSYFRVGYNAGPAGAAKIALELLNKEGFKWVYWGDDNDPPRNSTDFQTLLEHTSVENVGIIAAVGHEFDEFTGQIVRIASERLKGLLNVKTAAGGDCMIINCDLVNVSVVPDAKLFFGFEEFDFCYQVREAGYKIVVDGDLYYEYRRISGNLNKRRQTLHLKKSDAYLKREFYSKRNMTYIFKKYRLYIPLIILIFKSLVKAVVGFRYGFYFGKKHLLMVSRAIKDGLTGRMGKTVELK